MWSAGLPARNGSPFDLFDLRRAGTGTRPYDGEASMTISTHPLLNSSTLVLLNSSPYPNPKAAARSVMAVGKGSLPLR